MSETPSSCPCPPYIPATQITPDSVDEIPTQDNTLFTQESRRIIFDPVDLVNNHNNGRNYYDQLFSSGSEDDESNEQEYLSQNETQTNRLATPDGNVENVPRNFYDQLFSSDSDTDTSDNDSIRPRILSSNSDMSISDSETSEASFSELDSSDDMAVKVRTVPHPTDLTLEEQNELLGHKQPIPKLMTQEPSPQEHIDKIATINVRNKYNHLSAAELMVNENLTFIAFQEPFASCNAPTESWQSFSKCELQSARFDCFQTHHQIIIFDTFKWGGKVISNFESYLGGRVTGIAFKFDDGTSLGIIAIYASSAETHQTLDSSINDDIIINTDRITEKWTSSIANIDIIMLGDLQETCTISDRDNIGAFRKLKSDEGILHHLEQSHVSYARKLCKEQAYITRFGECGGRGLDHIMIPFNHDQEQSRFPNAYIARDKGATYFPSDHSMIICEYSRQNDKNNNEDSQDNTKYNYAEIYNIKVKRSGEKGKDIGLDMGQFKESDKFRSHLNLYEKLQKKTSDSADFTDYYIGPLETRAQSLIKSLWDKGVHENVNGAENKLVSITEDHALELSIIYRKFTEAIKEVMISMELDQPKNNLAQAGTSRGNLRKHKGFRMFKNLPLPSKLRYLRAALNRKANLIQKAQLWIKELNVRDQHGVVTMDEEKFWNIRDNIVKTNSLQSQSNSIRSKILTEEIEREAHVNAISAKQGSQDGGKDSTKTSEVKLPNQAKNFLPHISESMTQLINSWLKDSGCNHGFNLQKKPGWCDVLSSDISNWKMPMTEFYDCGSIIEDRELRDRVYESLDMCSKNLAAVVSRISHIQIMYKKHTLLYFLRVNTIDCFTRKVLQKQRSAPMTHSTIWDESIQDHRPCKNEVEELRATQEFHGQWMGNTKAEENCAFAKVITKGRLGPRGIKLSPDRKLTMADIPKLIHKGDRLSRKVKRSFLRAHNKHTANLFRAPKRDRKEFFYPFFLLNEAGIMNNESATEEKFLTSLASIPCKARHAGFQMATLGRFGSRWRHLLWKLLKIMFIMRYIPNDLKKISRYPIPKPGKLNEYRPISLCNDVYCFLNGIITGITSAAIEKVMLLHKGITSYRRGKSCATLVTVEQSFREDCIERNLPTVQLDEDEEKFFDRVCLEIILAAMRINGFPESGFLEFKACMMGEKIVEIITCKGTAFAKFVCGLEQGNPDSPTIANLVIKIKHDVWKTMTDELREIIENDVRGHCDKYKFYVSDDADGEVWIYMMGYCDDNTKFLQASNENDLLPLVSAYVQLAGDLSMVTKIGRKSSKCEIQFFNISANLTLNLTQCWSTAWSFVHDSPIEEKVPFKVFLQPDELMKFYKLIEYDNISIDEQEKWDKIVAPKAHKHLGLSATLGANTSSSGSKTINKMYDRLSRLKLGSMDFEAQRKCTNMLITSMHSYAPLQVNYNQEELYRIDLSIANLIMRKNGISQTDSKHRIFLPESMGGLGFLSTLEIDIVANAREIEIICNGNGIDSETFRSRIAAIPGYNKVDHEDIQNHALDAINKLAKYGFFFRDKRDGIINAIMERIARDNNIHTIGSSEYMDGNTFSIRNGKTKNLRCAYGSQLHLMLRDLQARNWITDGSESQYRTKLATNVSEILQHRQNLGAAQYHSVAKFYACYEWCNLKGHKLHTHIPSNVNDWSFIDPGTSVLTEYSKEAWEWDNQDMIHQAIKKHYKIPWDKHLLTRPTSMEEAYFETYSIYGRLFNFLDIRGSPLLVATDGAHEQGSQHTTAASFVLCSLDIRAHESMESGEWIHRKVIPLLARCKVLPKRIGAHKSDIAHGEAGAFVMAETSLDVSLPRITITDSAAVRNQLLHTREHASNDTDRLYIRSTSGGISKFLMGIVKTNLHKLETLKTPDTGLTPRERMIAKFTVRTRQFLDIAQSWICESLPPDSDTTETPASTEPGWNAKSFDKHDFRPILKVNSHQLDKYGQKIAKPSRYLSLTPNLAVLNANHHADKCAEFGLHMSERKNSKSSDFPFQLPNSNLNFFITANGETIDKHVSTAIQHCFNREKVKRLKTKSTQGLLWRLFDHITVSWRTIKMHTSFFRSLLGLTKTHTRSLYKSVPYRMGCLKTFASTITDTEMRECIFTKSTKEQLEHLTSCPWCTSPHTNATKGNRRHFFLVCNHDRIRKFRDRLNNTIGMKLSHLFNDIKLQSSEARVQVIIGDINKAFIALQNSQEGRKSKLDKSRNISYINIKNILQKIQAKEISDAIQTKPSSFFLSLFHITPEELHNNISDEEVGVIDTPWLGLMPSRIDGIILRHLQQISQEFVDKEDGMHWGRQLQHSWKEIMAINMGRCIGIHRILNDMGNEKEKSLIKEFQLENLVTHTRDRKRKASKRRTLLSVGSSIPQLKRQKLNVEARIETLCNGITCSRKENKRWCASSNFQPNSIVVKRKQCARCSVFITAMKATSDILIDIQSIPTANQHKIFILLQQLSKQHRIVFSSLMNMLKLHIPSSKHFIGAQFIRKSRPTEKWKRICKLLINLANQTQDTKMDKGHISVTIQTWISDITTTIQNKNIELKEDGAFLKQCIKTSPTTRPSPNQSPAERSKEDTMSPIIIVDIPNISPNKNVSTACTPCSSPQNPSTSSSEHPPIIEIIENTQQTVNEVSSEDEEERELLLYARINILNRNVFLAGSVILMAIEVIRHRFSANNVFAACTEAAQRIETWNPTQGWERFARIFYNSNVCNRRPDGVYLIPIFHASHWHLIAVYKKRRFRKAVVIDSMGTGERHSRVTNLISEAFKPNRGSVHWDTPLSRRQVDIECGPRTICAMTSIATNFAAGIDFNICVQRATLLDTAASDTYDQMAIRRHAANWTAQYRHNMRSRAIRN